MSACLLVLLNAVLASGTGFAPFIGPAAEPQDSVLQERIPADPAVTIGRLENGLTYYIRENRRPENRAELRLVVNAGSVLEDPDQRGLAHFVEHMAFNGTANFEERELVHVLERMGVRFGPHLNAYTSFDETVYQLQVPTDSATLLATGFQILEDWAHGIAFDTAAIRKERSVVIEEWRSRRGAGSRIVDKVYPVILRGSDYAERLPIGTLESLETFSPEAAIRFYRDWYRPDLMAVVVVGDIDKAEAERLLRAHFRHIPARAAARPRPEHLLPRRDSAVVVAATDREATRTQVQLQFFRPPAERGTLSSLRASLVSGLYTRMLNERLLELLHRPNTPFFRAEARIGRTLRAAGVFSLSAAVADTAVESGLEAVLLEVERVRRHGFTPDEFERAKRSLLRTYERAYEERHNVASAALASLYVQHYLVGQPIPSAAAQLELARRLLSEISLAEVDRVADRWLQLEDPALVVTAPEDRDLTLPPRETLLGLLDRVRRAEVLAYEETVSDAPLVDAEFPEARIIEQAFDVDLNTTTWVLENGVRVILKPTEFKADEVLFTAYSPGGLSLVPDTLFTSARVAASVVAAGGLGEFSAVELRRKLAGTAARAQANIGTYEQGLSGGASPADLRTLFELIYLRSTAPRADTAAFEAVVSNTRASLANRSASPATAFRDTLNALLTQHHPRSRPFTVAQLDSVDLGIALNVYRDRFADASNFTFVFVGSFELDDIRPLVRRYLGNLPALHRREEARDLGIRSPAGTVEREVHKGIEPTSETQIIFTGPFEDAGSPRDRLALSTLAHVLQIDLRERLREELGGTYTAAVNVTTSRVPQPTYRVAIRFGSEPDRVDELVAEVFDRIESMRRRGPDGANMAKVAEAMRRQRETSEKENSFWLNLLASADRSGEDPRDALDLDTRLSSLDPETLRATAEKYLDPQRFVRVTLRPEGGTAP